jgi:hypothetical protein
MSLLLFFLPPLLRFAAVPVVNGFVQSRTNACDVLRVVRNDVESLLAFQVLSKWIHATIQEQVDDFEVSIFRRVDERSVFVAVGAVDLAAAFDEFANNFGIAIQGGDLKRIVACIFRDFDCFWIFVKQLPH